MPLQHSWISYFTETFVVQYLRGCFNSSPIFLCNQCSTLSGKAGYLLRVGGQDDQASAVTLTNQEGNLKAFPLILLHTIDFFIQVYQI